MWYYGTIFLDIFLVNGPIFLDNTIQRDKTIKSEDIYEIWAEYSYYLSG